MADLVLQASTSNIDYAARAARADMISRIAFPAVFILFMIVFYCVCLLSPDPVVTKQELQ